MIVVPPPLTKRALTHAERMVLHRMMHDKSRTEIARELGLSPETVKTQQREIMRKIGVASRVQLAVWAVVHRQVAVKVGE